MGSRAIFTWASAAEASWVNLAASTDRMSDFIQATESSTLRRLIVDFYVQLQVETDGVNALGRVGFIIADQTVVAAGVSALPKPLTNGDQEWLWNRGYAMKNAGAVEGRTLHLHDDVRGMRKMKQTDRLVMVVENQGGGAIESVGTVRALFSA